MCSFLYKLLTFKIKNVENPFVDASIVQSRCSKCGFVMWDRRLYRSVKYGQKGFCVDGNGIDDLIDATIKDKNWCNEKCLITMSGGMPMNERPEYGPLRDFLTFITTTADDS